jgi:acyl carrier protein
MSTTLDSKVARATLVAALAAMGLPLTSCAASSSPASVPPAASIGGDATPPASTAPGPSAKQTTSETSPTYRQVARIIKEQLDVDESDIKPGSTFIDDLGADSLGLVELVLAFEEAFEIDIPDEDTETICTVADVVTYIDSKISSTRQNVEEGARQGQGSVRERPPPAASAR